MIGSSLVGFGLGVYITLKHYQKVSRITDYFKSVKKMFKIK